MVLHVTALYGLSGTYLDTASRAQLDTPAPSIRLLYRRNGDVQAPVECVVSDRHGQVSATQVRLSHDCLSCLVRERTFEESCRLAELDLWTHAVVAFPPGMDPSAFTLLVEACHEEDPSGLPLVIDACISVADALVLVDQITSCQLLREWDLSATSADERSVGEVAARQVEYADVILVANAHRASPHGRAESLDLIHQLNPAARVGSLNAAGHPIGNPSGLPLFTSGDPRRSMPLTSGYRPTPAGVCTSRRWRGPDTDPFIRSRGQLWFATHPTRPVGWESAGELRSLTSATTWPHVATGAENYLVLTGRGLDFDAVATSLDRCLLTETEMAEGVDRWAAYDNPNRDALSLENDVQPAPTGEDPRPIWRDQS